jgi:Protein of Unknown function (DUF2784)
MLARLAADTVLIAHLAFIVFATFGAALSFKWRFMPLIHLPAAGWAIFVELTGRICPLTYLENNLRRSAGESGYTRSFIEHYLLGVIYPEGLTRELQFVLAALVLSINMVLYAIYWLKPTGAHRVATKHRPATKK